MEGFYSRSVFYVSDAERSLDFYTNTLGFSVDWNYAPKGRAFVFQVSWFGVQLIINEIEDWTKGRAGHGRLFIGIADDHLQPVREHLRKHDIRTEVVPWGEPTLLIRDPDGNWLTFWLPDKERATLEIGQSWP